MGIELIDLKRMLPDSDKAHVTDDYYLTLVRYVEKLWDSMRVFPELDGQIKERTVLDLVAYYQDVVSDAGLWRSFVRMCRYLYRRPVPFYDEPDDYVDFELNRIDLQFVIWYSLEASLGFQGLVSPFDNDIMRLARQIHKLFDYLYDDAPAAADFNVLRELDLDDREQVRSIYGISDWLFWESYFLRPVSRHAYGEEEESDGQRLQTTFEQPTGPLALYVSEWLHLAVGNRMPSDRQTVASGGEHKYYSALRAAVGDVIAFCRTYDDLNRFLSQKLGWGDAPADGHLPQLKDSSDFVLYADRNKGLIVARGIAGYVRHPSNPLYDEAAAAAGACRMVMEPGLCPIDLLRYLFENNFVPDAKFPTGDDGALLQDNWDFLARLYLNRYYRAD